MIRVRSTIVYLNLIIILDTQNFNTNMKYKVGDKVRVREDLIAEKQYGKDFFVSEMNPFKGQIVTIKKIRENKYVIEEDHEDWHWTEEMFLPVVKYKIGDKVIIREDLKEGKLYGYYSVNEDMFSLRGKIVTICDIGYNFYILKEDIHKWCWTDKMFSGKVSEDFSSEESDSQNIIPEGENSSDIITVKTNKIKLLLL